jgi:hypothetical protein
MKKEAIFAILIGIILGLGITFGIYKFRQNRAPDNTLNAESDLTPTPTPGSATDKLLITAPKDEAVLSSTNLRVSGTAEANEMIVILLNDLEFVTQADSIGAFAQDVELAQGGNILEIIAIGSDGQETKQTLNVVVSTDSLDEKVAPAEDSESTSSAKATPKPTTKVSTTPAPTKKSTTAPTPKATVKEEE